MGFPVAVALCWAWWKVNYRSKQETNLNYSGNYAAWSWP